MFHPCRRHDIKTIAVVCFSSSRSTARSALYSRQAGISSCRCQHVEWPSVPHHVCTVARIFQTASQDFPLVSFLRGHPDMTDLWLWIIIIVFSVISCGPCNNWHCVGHVKHVDDDVDEEWYEQFLHVGRLDRGPLWTCFVWLPVFWALLHLCLHGAI